MRTCDLDVVARSAERGMVGDTLPTWKNNFGGTSTSRTCKGKEEFKVATAGAGEVITWKVIKTGWLGEGQIDPPCGFSKNVSSKERGEPSCGFSKNVFSKERVEP